MSNEPSNFSPNLQSQTANVGEFTNISPIIDMMNAVDSEINNYSQYMHELRKNMANVKELIGDYNQDIIELNLIKLYLLFVYIELYVKSNITYENFNKYISNLDGKYFNHSFYQIRNDYGVEKAQRHREKWNHIKIISKRILNNNKGYFSGNDAFFTDYTPIRYNFNKEISDLSNVKIIFANRQDIELIANYKELAEVVLEGN